MPTFEDRIPEEQKGNYKELSVLLHRIYHQKQKISKIEQLEALMHVEERLTRMQEEQGNFSKIASEPTNISSMVSSQGRLAQRRRITQRIGTLASVLVVGALISAMLLLQTLHMHSSTGSASTLALPRPTTNIKWNGLAMSMNITSGPYFLGEMVAVNFSLINQTHQTLTLAGVTTAGNLCTSPAFSLTQTGGGNSQYTPFTMPVQSVTSCPNMLLPGGDRALASEQSVTAHSYEILTGSGDITLVGKAFFYTTKIGPQGVTQWQRSDPLAGHFPTLHIHVMPQTPAGKMLNFHQEASEIVINAPTGVHLLDQTYIICQDPNKHPWSSGTGHSYWESVSTNALHEPACPGESLTFVQWKYTIGVVGYKVVQGQQGQYSVPDVP